jgi:RNA polymerase sigma-70 factor (ECF subfamily)
LELFSVGGESPATMTRPPARGHTDDAPLLARVAAGETQAFETLFDRYHATVYRFARQMGTPHEAADDITQEVFLALARNAARFDPRIGSVATYLYGITRNLLRRTLRWNAAHPEVELEVVGDEPPDDPTQDAHTRLELQQALGTLRLAIAQLPTRYREVIVLCELHELTYDEAARVVGCPIGTIRSRLNRARHLLAERCRAGEPATAPDAVAPRRCLA